MIVSIYKNVADTKGAQVDLFEILTTDRWRHLSDKVRAETDKGKRNKLKQQLPAFTPSGTFKVRNEEELIKHSGYMCIDIDGDDNTHITDWQAVVFELGKLPQIAFAGLSVSGNGVFALIPIKFPAKHKQHFQAFQKSFAKRGLVIDPKCGNVSRLRFYSYNEHFFINKEAEPYMHLYQEPATSTHKYTQVAQTNAYHADESDTEALVREIVASGINIVPDYESWFKVAAALSNVHSGRELFHRISQMDASKYNPKECNKMFDSIKPGKGITIATLFYMAKNCGIMLKRKENNQPYFSMRKPPKIVKSKLFADWIKPIKTEFQPNSTPQQHDEAPRAEVDKIVCFVDKMGVLYIPTPCSESTFSSYKSIEQYNSRKGLPSIIDKSEVDTLQMETQYINLNTLLVDCKEDISSS